MKASTNEKKRQVRDLRFLAQCLVSARNLRLEGVHVLPQLEAGELRAARLTPVGRRRDEPGQVPAGLYCLLQYCNLLLCGYQVAEDFA